MIPKFDVFSFMPFPVFVTDSVGVVIFKNDSCRQNIKKIRNGANAAKHIKDANIFLKKDKILFSETYCGGTFSRFAMSNIEADSTSYCVFLFLPMLQLDCHDEIERFILDRSNDDIFDFYIDVKNYAGKSPSNRLYSDMVTLVSKYDVEISNSKTAVDTAYLLDKLFKLLSGAFSALGIRVSTSIDKNIYYNRFCRIDPNDYIFVLTRLLYAVIRASSTKKIAVKAVHTEETDEISVTLKTSTERIIINGDICELAPECIFESRLISRYYMLGKNVSITQERDGTVNVKYTVQCDNVMATLPISNTYFNRFDIDPAVKKYAKALRNSLKNRS